MKTRLLAWISWITFLVSAISEWGFDIDLPLTPALWLVMAAVVFFATNVPAALTTNTWTAHNSKWEIGANWSAGTPVLSDSANSIGNNSTLNGSETVVIDHGTEINNGTNSCMVISNLTLAGVSAARSVSLLMTNFTLPNPLKIANTLTIGLHSSVVISNALLQIGGANAGTVSDDGGLTMFTGTIIVTNVGSSFTIGDTGIGNMTVLGGTWQARQVLLGANASSRGTLTMAGGTNILTTSFSIGDGVDATGTVWLTGGQLTITNNITEIGNNGVGQMTVSNGTWLAQHVVVGQVIGSQGTLSFAGGSSTVFSNLTIGNFPCAPTGTVAVAGGSLFVTNAAHTAVLEVRSGTLTLNSGTLMIDTLVVTNSCGHFSHTGGSLSITSTNLDPNFDADGDGFSNEQEASSGSDPFDPTSIPTWVTSWNTTASGKWETNDNWSAGAPSQLFTNVYVTNTTTKVVTIDATTTNTAATMTISNLMVAGPIGTVNTLSLSNAGTVTPLRILNGATINSGGAWLVTNSTVRVEGGALTVNAATDNASLTVCSNGTVAVVGPVTIGGGVNSTGLVTVTSGLLVVTNNPALVGTGSDFIVDGSVVLTNGGSIVATNVGFSTNNIIVGNHGSGSLTMLGGSLRGGSVRLGIGARSCGTMTMAGGTNQIADLLRIGEVSGMTSTVWVTGGQLSNVITHLGYDGVGQMSVSNGTWLGQSVLVGDLGSSQGTLTVAGGTSALSSDLVIGNLANATGAVWMTGGQLTITNDSTSLIVGYSGVGRMTVSNGTWLADLCDVGHQPGSQGTLTIAGGTNVLSSVFAIGYFADATGAVWVTDGQLIVNDTTYVGQSGVGQMTVSNGTWLARGVVVGEFLGSRGTLTVAGGTNVLSGLSIGGLRGAAGTVWVTGSTAQLVMTNGGATIGNGGQGQMIVSNGTVRASPLDVGSAAGSQGTLTIAGGTNQVDLGLVIGGLPNATGTVWVTGSTALLTVTNSSTTLGDLGIGRMTVSNGTWLARNVIVGDSAGSRGTLTIAGGTSSVFSNLTIGNFPCAPTGTVIVAGGNLFVTNAATAVLEVCTGSLILNSGVLIIDKLVMTNGCGHFVHTGGTLIYGTAVLDPSRDDDGDGLPNGWEQTFGLDPLDPSGSNGAAGDPDGDGFTNLQEYQGGTDPQNPNSTPFRITSILQQSNDVLLTWTTLAGTTNQVQATNGSGGNFATNGFADLSGQMFIGGSGLVTTNYTDTSGATNSPARYYRIRLVP